MKHHKQGPEGQDQETRLNVEPAMPDFPTRQGGGGGTTTPLPPTQGREVQIDNVGLINLSGADRGEHWIAPDETPTPRGPRPIEGVEDDG